MSGRLFQPGPEELAVKDGHQVAVGVAAHHGEEAGEVLVRLDLVAIGAREVLRVVVGALGLLEAAHEGLVVHAPVPGAGVDAPVAPQGILIGAAVGVHASREHVVARGGLHAEEVVHDLGGLDQLVEHRALGGRQATQVGVDLHHGIGLGPLRQALDRGQREVLDGLAATVDMLGGDPAIHAVLSFVAATTDDQQRGQHQRGDAQYPRHRDLLLGVFSGAGPVAATLQHGPAAVNLRRIESGGSNPAERKNRLAAVERWRERRDLNSRPPA